MSKPGRRRRSPERRIADREARSSVVYLERLQRDVITDAVAEAVAAKMVANHPVSETKNE